MRARGYAPEEVVAVGDSREDLGAAEHVGTFWVVANALEHDPTLADTIRGTRNVRVAEAGNGAGRLRGRDHRAGRAPLTGYSLEPSRSPAASSSSRLVASTISWMSRRRWPNGSMPFCPTTA